MLATFQCVYFFLQEVLNVLLSVYTDKNQANEFDDDWLDHGARVKDAEGEAGQVKNGDCKNNFIDHRTIYSAAFKQALLQSTPDFVSCEENWDDDNSSQDSALDTELNSNAAFQQSVNQTYVSQENVYLNATWNRDLLNDETSSIHSVDCDAWTANPLQKHISRSVHLLSERDWLDALESVYFTDMITELKQLLPRAFDASKNCFDFVIFVVKFADFDIQSGKKSLAYLTLVEFEAWLKSKSEGRSIEERKLLGYWPADEQKDLALEVVVSSTYLLFEPIKRTFQLDVGDNGFLAKHVRFLMHSKRKYKEGATIAYKLKLQKQFDVNEILLPLIIVDKLQLAESYVAGCSASLQLFMKMIDDLCGLSDEELEEVVEKTVSPKPKCHRLKNKALVKLGERLVKMFHLKAEDYPNIYKEKNLNGLRYLLQKKYSDTQPLNQKWDNLIETALGDNVWLQHKLVESLVDYNDIEEAARWAMFYHLPQSFLPPLVQQALDSWEINEEDSEDWEAEMQGELHPRIFTSEWAENSKTPWHVYRFPLPLERIFLIDNARSLRECMRVLCAPGAVVGFDTEWRPTMCRAGTDERLAIIQLSTWSEVFILDIIAMMDNVKDSEIQTFAENFFANPQVLKLGYGVDSDFKNLVSTCPVFEEAVTQLARFVDLCPLSKQILKFPSVGQKVAARTQGVSARQRASIEQERGLSELVFLCLGKPLDKTYQLSDWERRPLSEEQLIYAALDAYCLLEVYEVLKDWVKESRLRVNMELPLTLSWMQPKKEKQRRKRPKPGTRTNVILPALVQKRHPIAPQSLKIVVDTMLQGLGQHLRCCGVDVVILDNSGDHSKAVEISRSENRTILTSGLPYEKLRSQVPEGMCVCVPCGKIREQMSSLMKYFNVKVKARDIFSRCQVCNGSNFINVNQDHMRLAMAIFHGHLPRPLPGQEPENCPIDLLHIALPSGVPLKLGLLPEEAVNNADLYFCCSTCGKVFWEGKHHKRVNAQFAYLLENS